jgi:hypothetical protein
MSRLALLLIATGLAAPLAQAEIYRCQSPTGTSYQQMPCADETKGGLAGIASEYPPPNAAERERLFQREAAMYQRLEAERQRLSQESIARQVSAPAQVASAPTDEYGGPVWYAAQPAMRRWHPVRGYGNSPTVKPLR